MKPKIVLNSPGIQKLLKSAEVKSHIDSIAGRVANIAGPPFEVESEMHSRRYTANVIDKTDGAMYREAETGTLQRAVGQAGLEYTERTKGKKARK